MPYIPAYNIRPRPTTGRRPFTASKLGAAAGKLKTKSGYTRSPLVRKPTPLRYSSEASSRYDRKFASESDDLTSSSLARRCKGPAPTLTNISLQPHSFASTDHLNEQ